MKDSTIYIDIYKVNFQIYTHNPFLLKPTYETDWLDASLYLVLSPKRPKLILTFLIVGLSIKKKAQFCILILIVNSLS